MMQQEFEQIMGISEQGMSLVIHLEIYTAVEKEYMGTNEEKLNFCNRVQREQMLHKAAGRILSEKNAEIRELKDSEDRERDKKTIERQDATILQLQKELDAWRARLEEAHAQLHEAKVREVNLKAKLYDLMEKEEEAI